MIANAASLPLAEEQPGWLGELPDFPTLANVLRIEKICWRGLTIYTCGDAATHLYFVLKGRVKILRASVFENNQRRLPQALPELSAAAGRTGEDSVHLAHEELAELIGSTREVVTGIMLEFRRRRLIDYKRGVVRAPRDAAEAIPA